MKRLQPFITYYGSKWNLAPKYPQPLYGRIVEPFAGSACYSLLYPHLDVTLYDASPIVCGVWDYLIRSSSADLQRLPDRLEKGQNVNDFTGIPIEAKWLLGFWANRAASNTRNIVTANGVLKGSGCWNDGIKDRIIRQQSYIRHWKIKQSCYTKIDTSDKSTWFVDPPYQYGGERYPYQLPASPFEGLTAFQRLAKWIHTLQGRVIVCESEKANWLPFKPLAASLNSMKDSYVESMYTFDTEYHGYF